MRLTSAVRHRTRRHSVVLATVAAVVVASPAVVLLAGSAPDVAVESGAPETTQTTVRQVALDSVPSVVVDLVRSGLARAGVTLPPIDLSSLPGIGAGGVPKELLDALLPPTTTSTTPPPTATTDPRTPVSADLPAGAVVKEITRPDPFSMIALTWDDLVGPTAAGAAADALAQTTAYVRAQKADRSWGPWLSADVIDGGPARTTTAMGTEPIWVGATKAVQVAVTRAGVATPGREGMAVPPQVGSSTPVPGANPQLTVTPGEIAPRAFTVPRAPVAGDPLAPTGAPAPAGPTTTASGPAPATTPSSASPLENVVSTLKAALIDPGTGTLKGLGTGGAGGATGVPPGQQPPIITRAQWGADESKRCDQPTYDPAVKGAVVHHSAGSNDYTPEQSAEIVRGIYAYHAQTLGWCDIGYNALVDKYGQIFEGAFGGLDRNVQGTHTGGFNRETVGVAMLGNYNDVAPTPDLIRSVGSYLGWRLKLAGVDPNGTAQLVSQGFSSSKFGAGETSNLPAISGHRDYDSTECPGTLGYAALPAIRAVAAGNLAAAGTSTPTATPDAGAAVGTTSTAPATPTTTAPGAEQVLSTTDAGAIAQKWMSTGGPTGALGNALDTEKSTPDGAAKYVDFDKGKIYWSPQTGAQIVQGLIGSAWGGAGYEKSSLGLPTSGESSPLDGIITQAFQFGSLIFTKSSGVVIQVAQKFVEEFIRSMKSQLLPGAASAPVTVPTTVLPVPTTPAAVPTSPPAA
ncbi:MAG: N-acetylmuramoyl-L-alanine amidase [Gordonia paraffinivorans]